MAAKKPAAKKKAPKLTIKKEDLGDIKGGVTYAKGCPGEGVHNCTTYNDESSAR